MNEPADKPAEETYVHTRILKFGLGADESRAYWGRVEDVEAERSSEQAFREQWFGQVSESRAKIIMTNMRKRYDAYPTALRLLCRWRPSDAHTRTVICHWHLQLSDPLYRAFTGDYLVERRERRSGEVERDQVRRWVEEQEPDRWAPSTNTEFASKLLSAAYAAGLVESNRDPRRLIYPRVPDLALSYALHLLREVRFDGTLLDNPYLRSVGLSGSFLEDRIRKLDGVELRRMGDLTEFDSRIGNLESWSEEVHR